MIELNKRFYSLAFGVITTGCAAGDFDDIGQLREPLNGAARRPRSEVIRDVSSNAGLANGVVMAGIAQVETGLSHCWSEATWACRGPHSSSCDGPVIAGASDGACSAEQGGLGLFQFDAGTYGDTLNAHGPGILTLEGNIGRAVDFVVRIVREEVAGADTRADALEWINGIDVTSPGARFEQWTEILACRYNGRCGDPVQAAKYGDATLEMLDEFGADFWDAGARTRQTAGDVDGDGRADLVSSHSDGSAYVYGGNANGTFATAVRNFDGTLDSALHDATGHLLVGVADAPAMAWPTSSASMTPALLMSGLGATTAPSTLPCRASRAA